MSTFSSKYARSHAASQQKQQKQKQKQQKQKHVQRQERLRDLIRQFVEWMKSKMPSEAELAKLKAQGHSVVLGDGKWCFRVPAAGVCTAETHFAGYNKETGEVQSSKTGEPILGLLRGFLNKNTRKPDPSTLPDDKTVLYWFHEWLLKEQRDQTQPPMVVRLVSVKGSYRIYLVWDLDAFEQEMAERVEALKARQQERKARQQEPAEESMSLEQYMALKQGRS